jgi:predicted phosphodiesterase
MSAIRDSLFDVFLRFRLGDVASAPRHSDGTTDAACLYVPNDWVRLISRSQSDSRDGKVRQMGDRSFQRDLPPTPADSCRVCIISDTHEKHASLSIPECNILIHAGDILMSSRFISREHAVRKYQKFNSWLGTLKQVAKHIFVIGGNHDQYLEEVGDIEAQNLLTNAVFLSNSIHQVPFEQHDRGHMSIFGCSISRGSSENKAWQSSEARSDSVNAWKAATAGHGIDMLVSHSVIAPLLQESFPRVYVYGHFHAQYGVSFDQKTNILFICASIMDTTYTPSNLPIVVDIPANFAL